MKLDFTIFDTLLEPCVVLNREHQVIYCNETAAVLFGVSLRKIVRSKMTLESLLEFEHPLERLVNIEEVDEPTPVQEVGVKSVATGALGKLQISLQPIEVADGDKNWLLYVRDVTLEERLQNKYKGELEQKEVIINDLKESKKIIEDYSLNLERKVKDRTQEMRELNQTMSALLDSLSQGFFLFDRRGICLSVYSKACEEILEGKPVGKHFVDVLNLSGEDKNKVREWVKFLFDGVLPFDESILFGPTNRNHSKGRHIELEYHPIYDTELKLYSVVVVASDTTSLLEAHKEVEYEKNQAKLILNILRNRKQIHSFIEDFKKIIKKLNTEVNKPPRFRDQAEMFRGLHTLKGGSSSLGIIELSEHCHSAENILADIKLYHPNSIEVAEKWETLDAYLSNVEDSFLRFLDDTAQLTGKSLSSEKLLEISYSRFIKVIHAKEPVVIAEDVRAILIEEFVMEPVVEMVKGYQDSIDKLTEDLGKKLLPLEIQNGHIKILPDYYKNLFSSLVHIFRNAIDHGIELPEKRWALGKPEAGKITIEFQQMENQLKITIKDDGGGINPHSIRAKLLKNGKDVSQESDEQVIQHIFDAGFSTKQEVTNISGRGVGLDAVMQAAVAMGGNVRVVSFLNQGTVFNIEVPYIRKIPTSVNESARKTAA
jgi:two-component system chemotaxis sensor kinase CheA